MPHSPMNFQTDTSVDISQRVVEMPHSSTTLQMERVRRHFTESWKIFTGYDTITDGINPSVYFHQNFFLPVFSVCKTINNIFFTDRLSDGMWYYRRMECRLTFSFGDLVGKKFTDRIWILHRRVISVGKTVKSYSAKEKRICNEKELQDDLDNFIIELSHIKS